MGIADNASVGIRRSCRDKNPASFSTETNSSISCLRLSQICLNQDQRASLMKFSLSGKIVAHTP